MKVHLYAREFRLRDCGSIRKNGQAVLTVPLILAVSDHMILARGKHNVIAEFGHRLNRRCLCYLGKACIIEVDARALVGEFFTR